MKFFNKYRKTKIISLITVLFVLLILVGLGGNYGLTKYKNWRSWQEIEQQIKELERREKEHADLVASDTYGGKTPQETLRMYIEAAGKGDYELASRYFVVEKQEEQSEDLKLTIINSTDEQMKKYLNTLRDVNKNLGTYDSEKKYFSFDGSILVRMILYPNGIWKITEI